MRQFSAKIIKNNRISHDFFHLEFEWNTSAPAPKPGQFLTIRVSDEAIPLLRRPFAISALNQSQNTASIIFQCRGKATQLLSAKLPEDTIDVIGPLGNTFPLPLKNQNAILVAGGIGLGPILFLSKFLNTTKISSQFIFGCRNKTSIPEDDLFHSEKPIICTDDGSAGFKGTVSDYLKTSQSITADSVIYSCGPGPMLQACHKFAQKKGISCWVSVEQIMACGVGACMGCVVKIKQSPGYARACKDGPVFSGNDIAW